MKGFGFFTIGVVIGLLDFLARYFTNDNVILSLRGVQEDAIWIIVLMVIFIPPIFWITRKKP